MRWKSGYELVDKLGSIRIIRKFLLFPRRYNSRTWRWLSYEYVTQRVEERGGWDEPISFKWVSIGFSDETPNNQANKWIEWKDERKKHLDWLGWKPQHSDDEDPSEPTWPEGMKSK